VLAVTETLKTRIIELLSKDPDTFYSISNIAKQLKAAYSHAHSFVKQLAETDIVTIQKIGNVSIIKLNPKEQTTLAYLSLISYKKSKEWKKKNPQSEKLLKKIERVKDQVHCVLIKGGKTIIVVPEAKEKPDMTLFRNRTVIDRRQLKKNLDYYKDAIILHGAEKYWSLIQ